MGLLALITNALRALAAYYEVAAIRAKWELSQDIAEQIHIDEKEIDRLRNLGTSAAALDADRVRNRLVAARGVAAALSAPDPAPPERADGANNGGTVHAPDR